MVQEEHDEVDAAVSENDPGTTSARVRLAEERSNGHCRTGQRVKLSEIAAKYRLNEDAVARIFSEFQALGTDKVSENGPAILYAPSTKEMQQAYEIRAALEEIGGRAAARTLQGNTGGLRRELDAMREAFRQLDLDSFVTHDVAFHRTILQASENEVLLRLWDSLALDLRIRGAIEKVARNLDLHDVVESHQTIVDALEKGRGKEAGLLLRNHIETLLEFLRKSESDSGFHKALAKDLENAKDIQMASFPGENLSIRGLSCEVFYGPAQCIGGDYYDFLTLQTDRWGIAIGDVCGKGIGAALLMASLQASLRAQAMHAYSDLSTLIADVDRLVRAASPSHLYASLFYAEYDSASRILRYVNAGHNAPMLFRWRADQCEVFHLEASGTPLGLVENSQFPCKTVQLEIGDLLVMYTDGITETENSEHELWGQERLETLLRGCRNFMPAQIVRRILDEVLAFAKGRPQSDDMTLVVVGVEET